MAMETVNSDKVQPSVAPQKVPTRQRLLWIVPLSMAAAMAAATAANVIFYFILTEWIGEPLLMKAQFPPPIVTPMGVDEVILFSLIFSLGAGLVYAFLCAVSSKPEQTFILVSAVVLLVSFALPLMMPTPPVAMSAKYSLVIMHIIGAVVVVGMLVGLGRKRA